MDRIPAIDLTPFLSGHDPEDVVRQVRVACEEIGFLVVSGHGLPDGLIGRAFAQSRTFFERPVEQKRIASPPVLGRQRGYHDFATRNLGKTYGADVPADLRESFFMGPIDDHGGRFADLPGAAESYAPNVMPSDPPGFSDTMTALYRGFERLSGDMLRIFALALDLPEAWFADKTGRHFSVLSSHYYPPPREQPRPGQLRAGAHTDFGAMTMLAMTRSSGGLEVRMPDGTWVGVLAGPDELVINLGDMMARWTNGRWASNVHRVVNPPVADLRDSQRQSIAYFMHPDYDAPIRCIPSCEGDAQRFPEISAGMHIRGKIERSQRAA